MNYCPVLCPICSKKLTFECYGSLEPQYDLTCRTDYCSEITFDEDWEFARLYFCINPNVKIYIEKRSGSRTFPIVLLTIIRKDHSPISQQLPEFNVNDFNMMSIKEKIKTLIIFS